MKPITERFPRGIFRGNCACFKNGGGEQTASMEQITTASSTLAEMAEELQHSIRKFQL